MSGRGDRQSGDSLGRRRLRLGIAAVLAGGAFILTGGAGVIEIVLVATGVLLIGLYEWGKRDAPEPI